MSHAASPNAYDCGSYDGGDGALEEVADCAAVEDRGECDGEVAVAERGASDA